MVPWNVGVADRWSSAHRAEMRFRGRMIGLADGLALKGKRKGGIKMYKLVVTNGKGVGG